MAHYTSKSENAVGFSTPQKMIGLIHIYRLVAESVMQVLCGVF